MAESAKKKQKKKLRLLSWPPRWLPNSSPLFYATLKAGLLAHIGHALYPRRGLLLTKKKIGFRLARLLKLSCLLHQCKNAFSVVRTFGRWMFFSCLPFQPTLKKNSKCRV